MSLLAAIFINLNINIISKDKRTITPMGISLLLIPLTLSPPSYFHFYEVQLNIMLLSLGKYLIYSSSNLLIFLKKSLNKTFNLKQSLNLKIYLYPLTPY